MDVKDLKIVEICKMYEIDLNLVVGGVFVIWDGFMVWDKDDENYKGLIVFVIVFELENFRKGRMLWECGYVEIVLVVGIFEMDNEDGLNLIIEYEIMSFIERFWFFSFNLRMWSSLVKWFGGFNIFIFCIEVWIEESNLDLDVEILNYDVEFYFIFGW